MDKQDFTKTKKLDCNTKYRKLVEKLPYLANKRPDIAYAVQQLSQHLKSPYEFHLTAANRVLRYLKWKPTQGVFYSIKEDTKIKSYTDSDWANCIETRKSISSYCVFIGESLVS